MSPEMLAEQLARKARGRAVTAGQLSRAAQEEDYDLAGLDALCDDLHVDESGLKAQLAEAGFEYSAEYNRFW